MKKLGRLTRVAAIAAAAFAIGSAAAQAQTVKIGIILTYSGPEAEPGEAIDRAITLYSKLHEKDLPPGVKVEIIRRDDTGAKPEIARRIAQELVTRDGVQFLAGVIWSPNALAIGPVATEAKVPFVIFNAASSANTRASPYIVRFSWTVWQNAYPLGQYAAKQGWKNGYTIVSDYAPGIDAENAFAKSFQEGGGTIAGSLRVPISNPDWVPFLQRAKDAKPDVVFNFNPGGKQAPNFMKAWDSLGFKAAGIHIVATHDLVTDDELPQIGDSALGVITAGPYSIAATRPQNKAFIEAWHNEFGPNAIPNYGSVATWDGMNAIYGVIKQTKGKFTSDQALDILRHWKNPDSPRGPIAIDPETRDIVQNIYLRRVERVNGKLSNVEFETVPQMKDPWKELNPVK
jgi:branched-chain amino acid transport system substrate-binding protein